VYKCNATGHGPRVGFGDWDEFFARQQPAEWGGTVTMGSTKSRGILSNEMSRGDLVLCWQSDRRAAVGLCRVDSLRDSIDDDGEKQRELWLQLLGEPFSPPVPILDMRKGDAKLATVGCFRPGWPNTLYATTPTEASLLLRACGISPSTLTRLRGYKSQGTAPTGHAGFGTAEENKKVERAAVAVLRAKYKAWKIVDRQQEHVGYDFEVRRGQQERHIELKGTRGPMPSFPITCNELHRAKEDDRWWLAVVTNALSAKPHLIEMTGAQFLSQYQWKPLSYMARKK